MVYDPEADADDNQREMLDAIESVATGEITRAVRASNSEVGPIAAGDWMGIVRGEGIAAVADTVFAVATQLLGKLLAEGGELLTIITGGDADPAVTAQIAAWVDDEHPDVQIEVHPGGQPMYPYLFGVE